MPAKSVSQIEYDVTSYRNVLDQLKTLQDVLASLNRGLELDLTINIGSNGKRSGYVMQKFDVPKSQRDKLAWSQYVGSIIGLGAIRASAPNTTINDPRQATVMENKRKLMKRNYGIRFLPPTVFDGQQKRWHNFLEKKLAAYKNRGSLQQKVYDVMNLTRNLQWELNRLRVEMPFDLRQLTSQLNMHASKINDAVYALEIYAQTKPFGEKWIPEMLRVIRERIKKAELQKKVAEETQRRESEKTVAAQQQTAKSQPSAGPSPQPTQAELAKQAAIMAAENNAAIVAARQQVEKSPPPAGDNRGPVAVAGLLALLALTGG